MTEISTEPKTPSLEDSLEQIERLAAELSELTTAPVKSSEPAPVVDVTVPHDPLVRIDTRPAPRRPRPLFTWRSSHDQQPVTPAHSLQPEAEPQPSKEEPAAGVSFEPKPEPLTSVAQPAVAPATPEQTAVESDATSTREEAPESPDDLAPVATPPADADPVTDDTTTLPPLPRIGNSSPSEPLPYQSSRRIRGRAPEALRFAAAAAPPAFASQPDSQQDFPEEWEFADQNEPLFTEPMTESAVELAELKAEKRRRRRKVTIGVFAALLAIPAFALGAIQPWLDDSPPDDRVSVAVSERHGRGADIGPQPNPAVPNSGSRPSDFHDSEASLPSEQRSNQAKPPATSPGTSVKRGTGKGLSVTLHASNVTPTAGEAVDFSIKWSDGLGQLAGVTHSYGDGSPGGDSVVTPSCQQDQVDTGGEQSLRHTFTKAGTYTVEIAITTYTCDGTTEKQSVPITITVAPKPTPAPTTPPTTRVSESPSPTS